MNYRIYKNGEHINTIVADEDFVKSYCEANGYTYELEVREEPESTTEPSVWDELDAAYQEGVDSV